MAFEPVPSNLVFLRRHVVLNRLKNVVVVPAAVASYDGVARFSSNESSSVGQLDEAGTIEVEQVTSDRFLGSSGERPPNVIKIDVEGAELLVLKGARDSLASHRPIIFLATHSYELQQACRFLLIEAKYEI